MIITIQNQVHLDSNIIVHQDSVAHQKLKRNQTINKGKSGILALLSKIT